MPPETSIAPSIVAHPSTRIRWSGAEIARCASGTAFRHERLHGGVLRRASFRRRFDIAVGCLIAQCRYRAARDGRADLFRRPARSPSISLLFRTSSVRTCRVRAAEDMKPVLPCARVSVPGYGELRQAVRAILSLFHLKWASLTVHECTFPQLLRLL